MEKREIIARIAQDDEDRMLLARVADRMTEKNANRFRWTRFLNPHQLALSNVMAGYCGHPRRFAAGAHPGAQRRILVFPPEYLEDLSDPELEAAFFEEPEAPLIVIRAEWGGGETLTHRDFLGSLMGAGIVRETVGDILVGEGSCDMIVLRDVAPFLLQSLETVGRAHVRLSEIDPSRIVVPEQKTHDVRDTVASLRLDGLVSSGFALSRDKAAEVVRSGRVQVGSVVCQKPDRLLEEGDEVSVRGVGKMVLAEVGRLSKKGRIFVVLRRYD